MQSDHNVDVGIATPLSFFRDSLRILGFATLMTRTTPDLVQCLLLMTAFGQTTGQPDLSISILGLAIHKAKALGFASPVSHLARSRVARLCWSGCLSRDFYLSAALGRLPLMTEHDCPATHLPLTEEEDAALRQPDADPHPLSFFNEGIKLLHIIYRAFHKVYPFVGQVRFDVTLLQTLNRDLEVWRANLPDFLCPEQSSKCLREAAFIQLR